MGALTQQGSSLPVVLPLLFPPQALAIVDSQDPSQLGIKRLLHGEALPFLAERGLHRAENGKGSRPSLTLLPHPLGCSLPPSPSLQPQCQSSEGSNIPREMSRLSASPPQRDSTTVSTVSGVGSGSCLGLGSSKSFWLLGSLHLLAPIPQSLRANGPSVT